MPDTCIASVIEPDPAPSTQAKKTTAPTASRVRTALHPAAKDPATGALSRAATASVRLRTTRVHACRRPPSGADPAGIRVGGRDPALPPCWRAALRCSRLRYATDKECHGIGGYETRTADLLACYRASITSRINRAVAEGVFPTLTPAASSASCLAAAVPAEPETIAPAWPMVLPSGAVNPAT